METFEIILKNEKERSYRLIIFFFVILHVILFIYLFFNGRWWTKGIIGVIISADLFLFVLGKVVLKKISLYFTASGIEKRNFPSKKYQWDQLSNVLLKDNILTLDFKNNKLLQAQIETAGIGEEAFNTFAKEQLNKT